MAKRSDFAQKLLDDLRLRKERLASSSQSSNSSNSSMVIIDAYSYAKQNYRGSKHIRPNDTINGSRNGSRAKNWSSQQIVPYNKIRDLSSKTDSSFSSRAKNFPNYFSPPQIEEISKGIQRLNRILKACSEGVNFDRRSVQIGKELLKGAIDLENSLKIFSVKPEMKNQIKLLGESEADEEGNGNLAKEWELNRPRFSFDKEVEGIGRRTGFVQRPKEKKRIPNVIARLMGLEKLPEEEESVRIRADSKKLAVQAKPFAVNTSFVVMVNERPKKIEAKREKKNMESSNLTNRTLKHNSRVTKQKATETISTPQAKLKRNMNLKKCVDSKDELRSFNNNNNNVQKSRNKNELARARSMRQQSSAVREVKPTRREKLRVKGSEAKDQRLVIVKEADKIVVTSPKGTETLAINDDFSQNVRNDDQLNHETSCEDSELKCCVVANIELDETIIDTLSSTEPEPNNKEKTTSIQTITEETTTKPAEPVIITLTEAENELKQIFLKSQLFLNTAEALFELEIPIKTLHCSTTYDININEQIKNSNDEKLVLDCGYELMRRKGRRQELTVHPNYVVTKQKIVRNSFDGLVRELNEDFEKLKVYGRDYGSAVEEYFAGMLESDVAGKGIVMDVNCMWDLGWNKTVFAFVEVDEVVEDVEKFLINYLLDQITADFYF